MSIAPIPSDPYYTRILKTYFSWTTEDDRMVFWKHFAVMKGFTDSSPPVDSETLQSEFEGFLAKYKKWGLSISSLSLGNSLPASTSYYSLVLNSFFADESTVTKTDIWNGFIESQGYQSAPPDTLEVREAFNAYVRVISSESISKKINDYFSHTPLAFRVMLWDHFAKSKGSTGISLAESNQNLADFLLFVQRYSATGIRPDSFSLGQSIPTAPVFYKNFINAYFGNLTEVEQTDIWNNFLSLYGYSANPVDSEKVQSQFASYIQGLNSRLYTFQEATLLSPKEMESRIIASSVLTSLKNYLNATEQQIQVQSNTLMFYGKWQQYYTDMMTRVPNLVGGTAPKVVTNTSDLSQFTFGYNNISLSDVINWGIDQALKNPSQLIEFGNSTADNQILLGKYSFRIETVNNQKQLTIGISLDSPSVSASKTIIVENPSATPAVNLTTDELNTAVQNGFKTLFQENTSFINALQDKYGIPGRYLGITNPITDDEIKQNNEAVQNRAEVNALLQQYVENIRALRDTIRNLASQFQSSLNQSRQGINNQTSLWTTILETIDSIMKEITKKG